MTQGTGWIPKNQRDTAWYLYNEIFMCKVQSYQLRDLDDVREYGVPTSGDPELDRGAALSSVYIAIPISGMMVYFEKGIGVAIPNHEDCKRIYEIVNDHLLAWAEIVKRQFNPGHVPIKDLVALDKFASVVYPYAEQFFAKDINRNTFAEALMGFMPTITRIPDGVNKPILKTEHKSLKDLFTGKSARVKEVRPVSRPMNRMRSEFSSRDKGLNE